jgi:tRNA threonylcarbamoyl adenosine modification protein YeaZ
VAQVLIVVVDSATPAITAGLVAISGNSGGDRTGAPQDARHGGVEVLAEQVTVDARAHGELLTPAIAAVLAKAGVGVAEVAAVVAGTGPGPFTGLRVGLVTAAAFADARGIPAYGVCSLDALGVAAGPGRILVATDARRKEVYWAIYADGVRVAGPAVGKPAELDLPAGLSAAVGDGALRYADALGVPVRAEPRYPSVAGLAMLAADRVRAGAPSDPLTPLYLRRPDAVAPSEAKAALP